jgi:hypothetical protein
VNLPAKQLNVAAAQLYASAFAANPNVADNLLVEHRVRRRRRNEKRL